MEAQDAKKLIRLSNEQIEGFLSLIRAYGEGNGNAASSSKLDPNANVTIKTMGTLEAELVKGPFIQLNRALMYNSITEHFGEALAKEYIRQIEDHEIYAHDESSLKPYCVSVSMYPFLQHGTIPMGGNAAAPKHLSSFVGEYINLVYELAAHFAGAVATVEFLMYFDYFARKDYGDGYLAEYPGIVTDHLLQVIYSINEPAVARGNQSVFLNWSLFDENYFNELFGDFVFPDGGKPKWTSVAMLQKRFLYLFAEENKKRLLPFPVLTCSALVDEDGNYADKKFEEMLAWGITEGQRFFVYNSTSVDSLASCCRLKNPLGESKPEFSYTLGAGGVSTGSTNVITLNLNRLVQDGRSLSEEIEKIQKYHIAHRKIMEQFVEWGLLPPYDNGYIRLQDQFLTIGLSGMLEAFEYACPKCKVWDSAYRIFIEGKLHTIYTLNRRAEKQYGYKFNTEFVPGESLGVKFAQWDEKAGYATSRPCYNSYFYPVEDDLLLPVKAALHGSETGKYLDGGSALHINLPELPSLHGAKGIMRLMAKEGVPYYGINVRMTGCKSCGANHPNTLDECWHCGSTDLRYATRVIGYCRWEEDFSKERQTEASRRSYLEHR